AAAALASVSEMVTVLDGAGITLPRLLHGAGANVWRLIDEAAVQGYDTRVGFEDTLTMPDGSHAPSNAAPGAAARRRGEAAAPRRRVRAAPPAESRAAADRGRTPSF